MGSGENPPIERPAELAEDALRGKVALITGGASGLGRATAEALLEHDAIVTIADIDEQQGRATAAELACDFVRLDVTSPEENAAAVDAVTARHKALHLVMLNAGIESPFTLGDDFDPAAYRRAMAINLDGVVYGFHAARPALLASGGGSVVATASLAGVAALPPQPVYASNKAAVIGLVRSLGPLHQAEGIRVNAICPGFADTAIITDIREMLEAGGVPIIEPRTVADATLRVFADDASGRALIIQAGVEPYWYRFANVPRAR